MGIISGGGGGGGGSSTIAAHTVTLSSAQILALGTTPITIVPAVNGQIIVPLYVASRLHFGTVAYTEAGQPRLFVGATIGAAGWGSIIGGMLNLTATADSALYVGTGQLEADSETLARLTNVPLSVDETGAVTDGDGTVDVTTLYYLLTP